MRSDDGANGGNAGFGYVARVLGDQSCGKEARAEEYRSFHNDTAASAHTWNSRCFSISALARTSPLATRQMCSKTSAPTSGIVLLPSRMSPAERSISPFIRRYTSLLEASLITGTMALPMVEPRPVVKTTRFAPAATSPGVDS